MAGVRRRLRDVGATITGVLGALRDEVLGADAPTDEDGAVPTAVQTAEQTADPAADPAAGPTAGPAADPTPDPVCAAAVELALAAAREEAGLEAATVGEHLGVTAEGDPRVVTHAFACTSRAYGGWHWAVTVARAEGSDVVTVDEVVLLPGGGAVLAPAWVPYSERVQPGDLGAGDLLPPAPDDARLVPSLYDPEQADEGLFWELGLGRPRVLSREGRLDAADRWRDGDTGPGSPRAKAAPGRCGDCGFLVPLAGALGRGFGACANALAPDDGRVVALGHGCGAHSEQPVELTHVPTAGMAVDEQEYDIEPTEQQPAEQQPAEQQPADPNPEPADEDQAGELGHS